MNEYTASKDSSCTAGSTYIYSRSDPPALSAHVLGVSMGPFGCDGGARSGSAGHRTGHRAGHGTSKRSYDKVASKVVCWGAADGFGVYGVPPSRSDRQYHVTMLRRDYYNGSAGSGGTHRSHSADKAGCPAHTGGGDALNAPPTEQQPQRVYRRWQSHSAGPRRPPSNQGIRVRSRPVTTAGRSYCDGNTRPPSSST
jgi:hypothetical protein